MTIDLTRPAQAYAVLENGYVMKHTLFPGRYDLEPGPNPHDPGWGGWLYVVNPPGVPEGVRVGVPDRTAERRAVNVDGQRATSAGDDDWGF